jgi:hypothetical protein
MLNSLSFRAIQETQRQALACGGHTGEGDEIHFLIPMEKSTPINAIHLRPSQDPMRTHQLRRFVYIENMIVWHCAEECFNSVHPFLLSFGVINGRCLS